MNTWVEEIKKIIHRLDFNLVAFYHIMAAIRGPDLMKLKNLEYVFTAYIRAKIFNINGDNYPMSIRWRGKGLTKDDFDEMISEISGCYHNLDEMYSLLHYMYHTYYALNLLVKIYDDEHLRKLRKLAYTIYSIVSKHIQKSKYFEEKHIDLKNEVEEELRKCIYKNFSDIYW